MTQSSGRTPSKLHRIAILGAGPARGARHPIALTKILEKGTVLDWQLEAFGVLGESRISFIGGYRVSDILSSFPDIHTTFNPDWATTGPAASLGYANFGDDSPSFISYGDIVFRSAAIHAMAETEADVCLAIDTQWRGRYQARSKADTDAAEKVVLEGLSVSRVGKSIKADEADAEFAGVIRLSERASGTLAKALEKKLHDKGILTKLLDGDNLRTGLNNNLGFSENDRHEKGGRCL